MSDIIFHHPSMAFLFLLVPVFVGVFRFRLKKQREDMKLFGVGAESRRSHHISMEPWRLALLVLATSLIIVALTRPAINPHAKMIPREGRDVVFLLDVSRSMLAEDRLPNRLESAKASIAECVESLSNHRVGLVVFAGSSSILCPLTMDTDFFLDSLEKAGPDSVAHGGTRIGDAFLKVCDKLFSDKDQGYKDIVLISDGGEQGEGADKAIDVLNEKQVRLIAIGVGDPNQGARIPVQRGGKSKSDYLIYKNEVVWSKLEDVALREMVRKCDQGAYLPVGTRQMRLDQIYRRLSEEGGTQQLAEQSVIAYDEIYQWFIGTALFCLVVMLWIPHTRARPVSRAGQALAGLAPLWIGVMAWGMVVVCAPKAIADEGSKHAPEPQTASAFYVKGNAHYRARQYTDAVSCYQEALGLHPSASLIRDITYNLGNASFQASKHTETSYESLTLVNQSITMFRRVLQQNRKDIDAAVNNELARAERRKLEAKIKEEEKRRQELQVALDKIRDQLVKLVQFQQTNLPAVDQKKESDPPAPALWVEHQQEIAKGTDVTATSINELNEKFFKGIPREFTPVAETKKHVATAYLNQNESILVFPSNWPNALAHGRVSLQALKDALASLPQDADGQSDPSDAAEDGEDGDDSEQGENGDEKGDGEEGDSEDGDQGEMEASDATQMNLESIDLPPPVNSPEDIIRKSQQMQDARQSKGGKKKGKPVERDW